ncbi:MAG: TIGR02757 family protein [Bacteroidia bacterium]
MKIEGDILLKEFLEEKYHLYNRKNFIESDPVSIPHLFTKKQDIEIAGFLAATIAWGNRKSIITNANKLMQWMDFDPHQFVLHAKTKELDPFKKFVHRTFNGNDCVFFLRSLQAIYKENESMETLFAKGIKKNENVKTGIIHFRKKFLKLKHLPRVEKHISNPDKNSSAKRLCMYLRWMVRGNKQGIDFGIWKEIQPSQLCLPLDVHTGNVGRALGLLTRKQNDWQSVEEITTVLRKFDPKDPVKYDFALFGLGVFEKFSKR